MLINVVVAMAGVLILMAWVGWRYFLMRPASTGVSAEPAVSAGKQRANKNEVSIGVAVARTGSSWLAGDQFRMLTHWPLWLALLLVISTAASVLGLSGRISLDPLTAEELGRQQHIQAALNPEKLVPPPTLPPSIFSGAGRPGLEQADRDWTRLNPDFVQSVLKVFTRMEARGYPLVLLEGYRSPERQDVLADSHAQVTNARAFQSKHQYGMAVDVAPMKDGRLVISERDSWAMQAYQALGEEAEREGLIWGGRWKLKDFGHIEASGSIGASFRNKSIERAGLSAL